MDPLHWAFFRFTFLGSDRYLRTNLLYFSSSLSETVTLYLSCANPIAHVFSNPCWMILALHSH